MKSLLHESNLPNAISTMTVKNDKPDMLLNVKLLEAYYSFYIQQNCLNTLLRAAENKNPFTL